MGLTDKHLAYGDDLPQTEMEKAYFWKIERLEKENAILKQLVAKSKRGRWEIKPHKMMGEAPCCSECHKFVPIVTRYCPNCGAKMDLEGDIE